MCVLWVSTKSGDNIHICEQLRRKRMLYPKSCKSFEIIVIAKPRSAHGCLPTVQCILSGSVYKAHADVYNHYISKKHYVRKDIQ